jgi:hypothetical protein
VLVSVICAESSDTDFIHAANDLIIFFKRYEKRTLDILESGADVCPPNLPVKCRELK